MVKSLVGETMETKNTAKEKHTGGRMPGVLCKGRAAITAALGTSKGCDER